LDAAQPASMEDSQSGLQAKFKSSGVGRRLDAGDGSLPLYPVNEQLGT
jgi:hypothetical protein